MFLYEETVNIIITNFGTVQDQAELHLHKLNDIFFLSSWSTMYKIRIDQRKKKGKWEKKLIYIAEDLCVQPIKIFVSFNNWIQWNSLKPMNK